MEQINWLEYMKAKTADLDSWLEYRVADMQAEVDRYEVSCLEYRVANPHAEVDRSLYRGWLDRVTALEQLQKDLAHLRATKSNQ